MSQYHEEASLKLDDTLRLLQTDRRHVGNTMAVFVMQTLGCDVAALNTVHFSTHSTFLITAHLRAKDISNMLSLNKCRQSYWLQAIQGHQDISGGNHRHLQWAKAKLSD